jgi:deoxyribose-phosphate aldolase
MAISLSSSIEYTLLKPEATAPDYIRLCQQAVALGYYGVCVPPAYVALAKEALAEASTAVVSVVGFPFGYQLLETKVQEAEALIALGAHEVDAVMNVSAFHSGWHDLVQAELKALRAATASKALLKFIIESGTLDIAALTLVTEWCVAAGVDCIKTSSGFLSVGAEIDKVRHIRQIVGQNMLIKASGGIRTREQAEAFIAAGANRIGTSTAIVA